MMNRILIVWCVLQTAAAFEESVVAHIGCYRTSFTASSYPIPRRLELLAEKNGRGGEYKLRVIDNSIKAGYFRYSGWEPIDDKRFRISFGSGFVGTAIEVKKVGKHYEGTSHGSNDTLTPTPTYKISLWPEPCKK